MKNGFEVGSDQVAHLTFDERELHTYFIDFEGHQGPDRVLPMRIEKPAGSGPRSYLPVPLAAVRAAVCQGAVGFELSDGTAEGFGCRMSLVEARQRTFITPDLEVVLFEVWPGALKPEPMPTLGLFP